MIYVVTALYQEAHGLIRELELKKNTAYAPFEVFDNENAGIRLVVTGVGEIAAAAVVAAVCARDGADAADFLINIGCCAAGGCEPADRDMDSRCVAAEGAAGGCEPADRDMDNRSETCTCVTRSRSRQPGKRSIRIFCTGTRGRNVNL